MPFSNARVGHGGELLSNDVFRHAPFILDFWIIMLGGV